METEKILRVLHGSYMDRRTIATRLGIAPSTVSRKLSEIAREGLVVKCEEQEWTLTDAGKEMLGAFRVRSLGLTGVGSQ